MFKKLCINLIAVVALFGSGNIFAQQAARPYVDIDVGVSFPPAVVPNVALGYMVTPNFGMEFGVASWIALGSRNKFDTITVLPILATLSMNMSQKFSVFLKPGIAIGFSDLLAPVVALSDLGMAYHQTEHVAFYVNSRFAFTPIPLPVSVAAGITLS